MEGRPTKNGRPSTPVGSAAHRWASLGAGAVVRGPEAVPLTTRNRPPPAGGEGRDTRNGLPEWVGNTLRKTVSLVVATRAGVGLSGGFVERPGVGPKLDLVEHHLAHPDHDSA
jgi:hypothetical protein